ncbi:uncharacterized protein LOC134727961 [Mytilus trossulus]|uniref:uncharacterized protein LOC134727961 n=1 Tax=Mytilus trossulus TaxID=6551 RepID=UPI003007417E
MATAIFCDPCTEANLSISATKYCSDCEERLCPGCAESHTRSKAFKYHHIIDLSSVDFNVQISAKKICKVHPDMLMDYFCTDHVIVCCRACIPKDHRKCENVLPLEHASKDVKKSALFSDIMVDIKHLITTLNDLHDNRESNVQLLEKTKTIITRQISEVKSRLLKQIDDLERDLHANLSSVQQKRVNEISKQRTEISQVLDNLKTNEKEIDFLKDHGSNNQLFVSLHEQVKHIQSAEASVLKLISNSQEIMIDFDEKKESKLECLGTLSESVSSCQIQYKPTKFQQAQIMAQPTKHIAGFEMDAELQLKTEQSYNLIDICVTDDNKLLLTNHYTFDPKLYVYRDCKDYETELRFSFSPFGVAVIPGTDRAVVTLPDNESIQFINTTKMTKDNKVNVGFRCYGITAGHDRIYVGGMNGTIKTLGTNGKILTTIKQGSGDLFFMLYDFSHKQFFVRSPNKLQCIKLDGTLVYSKDVSGTAGVTRDRQGNIYYGNNENSNIQRMSFEGEHCEEMMNKDNGIHRPYGMCFNNDFTKLFVINILCTSVYVYKCKN